MTRRAVAGCREAMARSSSRRRLSLLLIAYLAVTLAMGWRLVSIQVVNAAEYRGLAVRQSQRQVTLPARRGRLYDRGGEPLAMSLAAATIYANPREVRRSQTTPMAIAQQLAPLLDRRAKDLAQLLAGDQTFVYLARQLPWRVGEQVTALRLPGLGVLEESRRVYPSDGLAAHVVGFAGVDGEGLAGLELGLDQILAGQPGALQLERAPGGLEISAAPRQVTPPVPGRDVVLTVDREIQSMTERVLGDAVASYGAEGGSAVVLDVATGQVLAMASAPTYDPERIGDSPVAARRNRVVTDIFEPGSVNKVITISAALEEEVVSVRERLRVPDTHRVGSKVFSDSHSHPTQRMTLAEIVAQSSNIGTIKIAQRLGPRRLHEYLARYGYGRETGVGFPGESAGLLPGVKGWWDTSLPTISIGQGVSASLLQVASVFTTIAAGGEQVQPSLVRGTVRPDGRLQAAAAAPRRRVVSAQTAGTLARMLVGVVDDEYGTCELCAVPGYAVGGKTGTAQKPSTTHRGYEPGAYVGSFVGFAPAEDPAVVVGVALDEPRPLYYGGLTAGPVFADIMGFVLNHRHVPPSDPKARSAAPVAGSAVTTAGSGGPSPLASPLVAGPRTTSPLPGWAQRPALPAWVHRPARR
ncbi:MAG: penicillin-binding protein 2 [Euzebyaceae bacterium]|jgi:cell division protein FtsI (penicillin-binding protein 3)|nr:penicillin-binding protein 2 [Euzebyaceae bacterium]